MISQAGAAADDYWREQSHGDEAHNRNDDRNDNDNC